jgi:hypothetical protein
MAKVKFELNLAGLNEVMKSAGTQGALETAGRAVAGIADGEYDVSTHVMNYIAQTNVYAVGLESYRKTMENNELLKAVGAAGLPMTK